MFDDLAPKMAEVVTTYSQPVNPGDCVFIQAITEAAPLVEALYEAILRKGGHPVPYLSLSGLSEIKLMQGNDKQLQYINPVMRHMLEEADIFYSIMASANTKALTQTDPQRMAIMQKANQPLNERFFERLGKNELRLCIMPWPTNGDAQEAEMGLHAYRQFVYEACALHEDDPVTYWQAMRDRQQKLVDYLSDKQRAEVKGPGIDLSFDFKDRVWVSAHGELNFPDGEIFTGPIEDSVNGTVAFNMRTVYAGREVNGVQFTFKDGEIVEASAEKGEEFLMSQLDLDDGARRLGEFAIGTNWHIQTITGSTLFDEKIGGSIHMAIGRSIPQTKGKNVSNVHWDMVHDMQDGGEIYIDGELFYQNGQFVIDL